MAKKAKEFAGGNGDDPQSKEELFKFRMMDEGNHLNCHAVPKDAIVELTKEEAANHRAHGMRLDDVPLDDTREVFQCRTLYEAKDGGE